MIYEYELVRSNRKTLSIQIRPDMSIIVRAPKHIKKSDINDFVKCKEKWIEKHLNSMHSCNKQIIPLSAENISKLKVDATKIVNNRVSYFADIINVTYNKISIRAMTSRWGSCSLHGNLCFNCLLILCPDNVINYVIIHELCHRKEMNHSSQFWNNVAKYCPDYKICNAWLKENGAQIIRRIKNG